MENNYENSNNRQRNGEAPRDSENRPNPTPSQHVHVRQLSDRATEDDVVEAVRHFGPVRDVMLMPRRQALIKFEMTADAQTCVDFSKTGVIYCGGQPALFTFSTNQTLGTRDDPFLRSQPRFDDPRNQSLLPAPRFGNGPTAYAYNGTPIADGPGRGGSGGGRGFGGGPGRGNNYRGMSGRGFGGPTPMDYDDGGYDSYNRGRGGYESVDRFGPVGFGPRGGHVQTDRFGRPVQDPGMDAAVCMVYGLNMDKMNCDRLFNLFCLYGNVGGVKFMYTKEGAAMVELADRLSCERAVANLNQVVCFGSKIYVSVSKQGFLREIANPNNLPNGTVSYKDFKRSRNNRFNRRTVEKNRIQRPSNILHFYNAPPSVSDEEITEMFDSAIDKRPLKIQKFPSQSERSSAGVIEFETEAEAVEGLIICNHKNITPTTMDEGDTGEKRPFIFKLAFSSVPPQD